MPRKPPPKGRPFVKGQSGNPSGKSKAFDDLRAAAKKHAPEALATLLSCLKSPDGRVQVAAANSILDRGFGRPAQAITGEDGKPIEVKLSGDDARTELAGLLAGIAARVATGGGAG